MIGDTDEPEEEVNENLLKSERSLICVRPFLRSRNLSTKLKTKLAELFIDLFLTYGLSAIIVLVKNNNILIALRNMKYG